MFLKAGLAAERDIYQQVELELTGDSLTIQTFGHQEQEMVTGGIHGILIIMKFSRPIQIQTLKIGQILKQVYLFIIIL